MKAHIIRAELGSTTLYPLTDGSKHVCYSKLIHCYHQKELFSKGAFSMGEYKNTDMSCR
jgi:hypothetical protein